MKPSLPLLLLGLAGGLAGCNVSNLIPPAQPDPTRYFLLSAEPQPSAAPAEMGRLRVGLKHVQLAGYLRARSIVVRRGANEIRIEDFDRWAEPLGDGIARLLHAQLLQDPAVASASMEPFAFDADRDYDIAVTVLHCEGAAGPDGRDVASFAAAFDITTTGVNPRIVAHRVYTAPDIAWDGRDYGRLAAALSRDVDGLGNEIVSALNAAPPPPAPAP